MYVYILLNLMSIKICENAFDYFEFLKLKTLQ